VALRLQRSSTDLLTCHVGVSLYRSAGTEILDTAVAHIFNERPEEQRGCVGAGMPDPGVALDPRFRGKLRPAEPSRPLSNEMEDPEPLQVTEAELAAVADEAHRMGYRLSAHAEGLAGCEAAVTQGRTPSSTASS
jgi:hypothetical protein